MQNTSLFVIFGHFMEIREAQFRVLFVYRLLGYHFPRRQVSTCKSFIFRFLRPTCSMHFLHCILSNSRAAFSFTSLIRLLRFHGVGIAWRWAPIGRHRSVLEHGLRAVRIRP